MKIYLVSALVENETKIGHRALILEGNSEEEIVGLVTLHWQNEGWKISSICASECKDLIKKEAK